MRSIRCGRGLGDSIYLQSVARHLVRRDGAPLQVHSDWPDVFRPLGDGVRVVPFSRTNISILAHYASRKGSATTQFQDCCINAGITGVVDLRLDWTTQGGPLVDRVLAGGKPVVCVQLPRSPMGRSDGFGAELLPVPCVTQKMIDHLRGRATIVQVGAGKVLHHFRGIDIDLANKTTVRELLDVASVASGFVGYCSFMLALAEALDKPSIMAWARAGLESKDLYVRQITPQKIIEKPRLTRYVYDDCAEQQISEVTRGFLQ